MPGNARPFAPSFPERLVRMIRPYVLVVLCAGLLFGLVGPVAAEESFAAPAIKAIWERTERPVAEGRVGRAYLWGPAPISTRTERYDDAGRERQRTVQYFDKGRLELTQPAASDLAQLQGSSLVRDMALGMVQVGSNRVQLFDPAFIPVAGDGDVAANPDAPRYADFAPEVLVNYLLSFLSLAKTPSLVGKPITATIQAGQRGSLPANAPVEALNGAYDQESGHNIAAPFWQAFGASGPVIDPASGREQVAPLYDWRLLVGAPLTEPAWSRVAIGGRPTWVLIQLFERRVMTYRPDAPEGWRVEMANTGQHYLSWRYGAAPTQPPAKPLAPLQPGRSGTRLPRPPQTPTTPYQVVTWLPESINGAVAPGVGPAGVRHAVLVKNLRIKELLRDEVVIWFTMPSGRAVEAGRFRSVLSLVDERLDGLLLGFDTMLLDEGLWAMTVEWPAKPEQRSITYVRVTAEPREIPTSLLLNPAALLGLADVWLPAQVGASLGVEES